MSTSEFAHNMILDAAKTCYLRHGVAKTTAADIAKEAGVSRATLYRRFPSHNEIFLAVLARDSWEMVESIGSRLADISDPAEHMIEGILYVLDEIVRRPLHAHLFSDSGNSWALSQIMGTDDMRNLSVQMILAMPGMRSPIDAATRRKIEFLAEWILRIMASYAAAPSHLARNRDQMRDLLQTTLEPTVRALLREVQATPTHVKSVPNRRQP